MGRSGIQTCALVLAIITSLCILVCMGVNIATGVKAATDHWFVQCRNCDRYEGNDVAKCQANCCDSCGKKEEAFFYIYRIYSVLFSMLAILAEFPKFKFFRKSFRIFKFYWGRGFLQVFIGFITVTGNVSPKNPDAALWAEIIGYCLMVLGLLHCFMSCLCFKDKSDQEHSGSDGELNRRDDGRRYDGASSKYESTAATGGNRSGKYQRYDRPDLPPNQI